MINMFVLGGFIMNKKELDFSVFVLHSLADKWQKSPVDVYRILNDTGILDNYVIKCYDVLHTLGKEYLTEDITDFVKEKGVKVQEVDELVDREQLTNIYKQNLDEAVVNAISELKHIDIRSAMDIYYSSKLAVQIEEGRYGIDNLDSKYLAEDLIENESELFV
jgi:hypothetical protein